MERPHLALALKGAKVAVFGLLASIALEPLQASGFQSDVPAGFENLVGEQHQVIDLIFEGRLVGVFTITVNSERLQFDEPRKVFAALPLELQNEDIRSALEGHLDRNTERVCPRNGTTKDCGYINPSTLEVIHDAERYVVELFVNPRLVIAQELPIFLPEPKGEWSAVSQLSFIASGQKSIVGVDHFASADTIVSYGATRFVSALTHGSEIGALVEEARIEHDFDGLRTYAGLFNSSPSPSPTFTRTEVVGIGIASQIDTRLDKHQIIGNPVVVYLQSRGRVEVKLDNRLLFSGILDAGSNTIDTSSFPQGAYELEISITEPGRAERSEKQFFSKNSFIPPSRIPSFFLEVGKEHSSRTFDPTNDRGLLARGGVGFRLSEHLAAGAAGEYRRAGARGELQVRYVGTEISGEASLGLSDGGRSFGAVRVYSSGREPLNFNFDLRQTISERQDRQGTMNAWRSSTQATGTLSYRTGAVRFSLLGRFRKQDQQSIKAFSAGIAWDVIRRGNTTLTINSELSTSSVGEALFVGANFRVSGQRGGLGAAMRYQHGMKGDIQEGFFGNFAVDGQWDVAGDATASALASVEKSPTQTDFSGSAEISGREFVLNADILRSASNNFEQTSYSFGGSTTLLMSADGANFARRSAEMASIAIDVDEAHGADIFEVLIDDQPRELIQGGKRAVITVPAYEAYSVRLKAKGPGRVIVDEPERVVAVYPGSFSILRFDVKHITSIIGRAVYADGKPVSEAVVTWEREVALTDPQGYFQIDAPPAAGIQIVSADGRKATISLPDFPQDDLYVRVGDIIAFKE